MPLYEYRCRKCGGQFEVLQAVGADGKELECPTCGARGPDKQLSTFATGDDHSSRAASLGGAGCSGFT